MVATRAPARALLPGGTDPSHGRLAEIARGLASLVAAIVLVVGVPVALWMAFGTPWPDSAPTTDWIYASFGPRDVLAVLVAVVWLAWLHFTVCLLVEFVAERRGRGLSPLVPGGSLGTQSLAKRLVGSMLLLTSGVALAMPTATAVTTRAQQASPSVVAEAAIQAGSIASADNATTAGATPAHDTAAFTEEKSGGIQKYVEVQPPSGRHYDSAWGIAERYLGDGMRYKEIVALNRGVVQPDGTSMQDPDLIFPGYILRLPADATGPGLRVHAGAAPVGHQEGTSVHRHGDHQQTDNDSSNDSTDDAAIDGVSGTDEGSDTTSFVAAGGFTAGGVLLAAGLVLGLRRRRGWSGGPNPRGGKKLDQEFDLRGSADEPSAVFVDKVLRSLGGALPQGASLPGPTSCVLGMDGLAVTFPPDSRMRLSAPWSGDAGGRTWVIRRQDVAALKTTAAQRTALSPWPGLVAVGSRRDAVETLLDVESVGGIVSLSGDLDVAREVAVGLGLALATNRWSDAPRVNFVGFADDLSLLAPDRIRHYDDLGPVFEIVDAKRRRQHSACAAGGYDSVRTGRMEDPDIRLWAPEFIVLSGVPSDDDVQRLAAVADDHRSSISVIVVGDVKDAPVRMVSSTEGRLWCGPLGVDVEAHRVSADTYHDALSIFDAEFGQGSSPLGPDSPGGAIAAPVVDPDALDLTSDVAVEITSLGRVSVTAPGAVDEERRDLLTELVIYLALHPEGIHPNVLSAALWPKGVADDVRDSTLAQAATWLGVDAHGAPRLAIDDEGRWNLGRSGVRFDWDVFRVLANRSSHSPDAIGDLEQAMSLVTGVAWTGLPARRYAWLAYETVEADTGVAGVAVSRRLAQLAADAQDPMRARAALHAGLRLAPACEEIWLDALKLADRFAGKGDVTAVAVDLYAAIARHGSPRGAKAGTDALVDELIPGFRRPSAA